MDWELREIPYIPGVPPKYSEELVEGIPRRFWDKVEMEPTTGCWLWSGGWMSEGYGKASYQGKEWGMHRFFYTKIVGEIPEGLMILHKCDTPQCVNPQHLRAGTQSDNMLDARKKGRYA